MNQNQIQAASSKTLKQPQSFDIFKVACVGMFPIFNVRTILNKD